MHNNVDIISENYYDIATEVRQMRQF